MSSLLEPDSSDTDVLYLDKYNLKFEEKNTFMWKKTGAGLAKMAPECTLHNAQVHKMFLASFASFGRHVSSWLLITPASIGSFCLNQHFAP